MTGLVGCFRLVEVTLLVVLLFIGWCILVLFWLCCGFLVRLVLGGECGCDLVFVGWVWFDAWWVLVVGRVGWFSGCLVCW